MGRNLKILVGYSNMPECNLMKNIENARYVFRPPRGHTVYKKNGKQTRMKIIIKT